MIKYSILLFSLLIAVPRISVASDPSPPSRESSKDVADTGSAASFDKRLPPVIPGEQIQHNGRKMRVWSTSGEVPVGQVAQPPQAPANGQQSVLPNVGIIVDQRRPNRR